MEKLLSLAVKVARNIWSHHAREAASSARPSQAHSPTVMRVFFGGSPAYLEEHPGCRSARPLLEKRESRKNTDVQWRRGEGGGALCFCHQRFNVLRV